MLFLASGKRTVNVGSDDSDDNKDRTMSPVYFN